MYRLTENYVHLLRAGYRGSIDFNSFSDLIKTALATAIDWMLILGQSAEGQDSGLRAGSCMGTVPHGFPALRPLS